jgi:hypothetical protein
MGCLPLVHLQVIALTNPKDFPTVLNLCATSCSVKYPKHLPHTCLMGTARERELATSLAAASVQASVESMFGGDDD